MLVGKLGINILDSDFQKIEFKNGDFDFSYHVPTVHHQFTLVDLYSNRVIHGSDEQLRKVGLNESDLSPYHQLFRMSHRSCKLVNETIDTNRKLVFNTDSMSIPIIPILINYYKEILVIDVRDNTKDKTYGFKDIIQEMNPEYLVNLFFDVGYFDDKKHL